jgi:hypothetical protein
VRTLRLGCGLGLLAAAAVLGAGYLLFLALGASSGADADPSAGLLTGAGGLLFGLAGASLLYGALAPADAPVRRIGTRPPAAALLGLAAVLLLGDRLAAGAGPAVGVLMPPLHALAALLPAVAIVAAAAWWQGGEDAPEVHAQLVYGGCVAAGVALVVELALVVGLAALVFAALSVAPGGAATRDAIEAGLGQLVGGAPDPEALARLLLEPAVLLPLAALLGLLGPLVEELAKLGGVALRAPTGAGRAWVLGVAAGAGFGVTEAVTQGAVAADAWAVGLAVRACATLMHATVSGVAALGWHALVVERRPGAGLARLALAVVAHAVWNGLVLSAVLAALWSAEGGPGWAAGLASAAAAAVAGLFAAILLGFRAIGRRLAEGGG